MSSVRPPAVAGAFYPSDPAALRDAVDSLLDEVRQADGTGVLRGLIAPHAGYAYSGRVAASAFRRIADAGAKFTRAVGAFRMEAQAPGRTRCVFMLQTIPGAQNVNGGPAVCGILD